MEGGGGRKGKETQFDFLLIFLFPFFFFRIERCGVVSVSSLISVFLSFTFFFFLFPSPLPANTCGYTRTHSAVYLDHRHATIHGKTQGRGKFFIQFLVSFAFRVFCFWGGFSFRRENISRLVSGCDEE